MNVEKRGRCDDGTLGGLDADRFLCRIQYGGCGEICGVDWPADISALESLLLARPVPNRNWTPDEDITDVLASNVAHGITATQPQLYAVVGAVTGTDPAALASGHLHGIEG